jgi:hypothetical protein
MLYRCLISTTVFLWNARKTINDFSNKFVEKISPPQWKKKDFFEGKEEKKKNASFM